MPYWVCIWVMFVISNCSIRNGLWTNAPGFVASETLNTIPIQVVKAGRVVVAASLHSAALTAFSLAISELAMVTSCCTRNESVLSAEIAAVWLAWQPLCTHERKVWPDCAQLCDTVG